MCFVWSINGHTQTTLRAVLNHGFEAQFRQMHEGTNAYPVHVLAY